MRIYQVSKDLLLTIDETFEISESKWKPSDKWLKFTSFSTKKKEIKILGDLLTILHRSEDFYKCTIETMNEILTNQNLIDVNSIDWIIEPNPDSSNLVHGINITGMGVVMNYEFAPHILVNSSLEYLFIFDDMTKITPLIIEVNTFKKLLLWSKKKLVKKES